MSRLTKKVSKTEAMLEYGSEYIPSENAHSEFELYCKLGKLEDLEQDLGCPLEVVFKALKEGIYIENLFGKIVNFKCRLTYKNEEMGWYFNIIDGYVLIKDYKKTWWLKGDMENEKD